MHIASPSSPLSSPALPDVKSVDAGRDALLSLVLPVLDHAVAATPMILSATVMADNHSAQSGPWLSVSAGMFIHFVQISGRPAVFHAERLTDIVATIDTAEPLLACLEARLGIAVEPDEVTDHAPPGSTVIAVAAASTGDIIHLAFAPGFEVPPTLRAAFDALDANWSQVPVGYQLYLAGSPLGVEIVAGIGPGDMLIIGRHAVAARILWPLSGIGEGVSPASEIDRSVSVLGRYDLVSGQFTATGTSSATSESSAMTNSASSEQTASTGSAGFVVPLSIRLPNRMASVADLSNMRVGTTLSIGPITQGLAVSLMVSDREIAVGELVQIGDQFAILISDKAALTAEPAPAAPPETTIADDRKAA